MKQAVKIIMSFHFVVGRPLLGRFQHLAFFAITVSPAGLSRVNGVRRTVVLKHETSTLRQKHNFISIDFKFGVGDYVCEITNPDKFGSGSMSGRDAT